MRFIEHLIESKVLSEAVSDEKRAQLKAAQDREIARVQADTKKKADFEASPEGKAKREAGKAKGAQIEKDRLATNAKVSASMKEKMAKLKSMSPEERKASSDAADKSAAAYTGKKGIGFGKHGSKRRNNTGD